MNIQDSYDPRVDQTAGRDKFDDDLDPSDLLYTAFGPEWDGVDNDGNGYTDDISGWDFFGNDNDAFNDWDNGNGTHGTGRDEGGRGRG